MQRGLSKCQNNVKHLEELKKSKNLSQKSMINMHYTAILEVIGNRMQDFIKSMHDELKKYKASIESITKRQQQYSHPNNSNFKSIFNHKEYLF